MESFLLDHVEKEDSHDQVSFLNLPLDLDHIQSIGQKNTILTTTCPSNKHQFYLKSLRVNANTKQGQTSQLYDYEGGMLGLTCSIINQRKIHRKLTGPHHMNHLQQWALSIRALFNKPKPTTRNHYHLSSVWRPCLIREHKEKQIKKSDTQARVSQNNQNI